MTDTDLVYVAVIFNDVDPCFGMVPDFAISSSGADVNDVVLKLQRLAEMSIYVSRKLGRAVPTPTDEEVLRKRWGSEKYSFSSFTVRV